MEGHLVVRTGNASKSPVVPFAGRFGRYAPEAEKDVRKADVREDEVLKQLKSLFTKFECECPTQCYEILEGPYNEALKLVRGLNYSAQDVTNLSIALAEFQDMVGFPKRAGLFLSALVNNMPDEHFVIHTKHLAVPISDLGYRNIGNVTVKGSLADLIGHMMVGGTMVIEGNVRWALAFRMKGGHMEIGGECGQVGNELSGGTILVKGDAGSVGDNMEGGLIIIKGNAVYTAGRAMKGGAILILGNAKIVGMQESFTGNNERYYYGCIEGGEIHVEGDLGAFGMSGSAKDARIYHKGKLIAENGKIFTEGEK